MVSRILAFRPANAVHRLPARSGACPLSARELLGPVGELGIVLPLVQAPIAAVARGALVAAKELQSALGLALPPGAVAGPWFDAVTRAADEIAAGLPLVLSAEVAVTGEAGLAVERAIGAAWALLDAGVTHIAIDVAAVTAAERGRVLGEIAQSIAERGVSIEAVVPLADGAQGGAGAVAMLEEMARRGAAPDAASLRFPAPADEREARVQAAALARACQALGGIPVVRRGPVTPALLALLRSARVSACEDGGAAAARVKSVVPPQASEPEGGADRRASPLDRVAAELPEESADRLEASAYVEVLDFIERLGARHSAVAIGRILERRLEER